MNDFQEYRSLFLQETDKLIVELENLLEQENWSEAKRLVHILKGRAGLMGYIDIENQAKTLEKSLIMGKKAECRDLVHKIKEDLGKM